MIHSDVPALTRIYVQMTNMELSFVHIGSMSNSNSNNGNNGNNSNITAPPTPSTEDRPSLPLPPAACPFSGVAIDPILWESFQVKLGLNDALQRHAAFNETEEGARCFMLQQRDANGTAHFPPNLFLKGSETNSYRVQIINETTKRSKDLLLDRSKNESLYNAIYDNPRVKEAHIRKWGSQIAKDVKSGNVEVRMKVVVGDELGCWWCTMDDMKANGTEDLYQRMIATKSISQEIKIYLVCVPKDRSCPEHGKACGNAGEPCIRKGKSLVSIPHDSVNATSKARLSTVKEVNVDGSTPSRALETALVGQRVSKDSPVAKKSIVVNPFRQSLSSHSSGNRPGLISLEESARMAESDDMVGAYFEAHSSSTSDGLTMSILDTDLTSVLDLLTPLATQAKTTMGVRVINRASKRSKDLVLQINDTDTVYEVVYDHPGVKAAHVRKWGSAVVHAVKSGSSEIQFCVWDDDTDRPWRVFSIDELKSTTTRQLYELVSESSNLIKIYLQCVRTDSNTSGPERSSFSAPTAIPEYGVGTSPDKVFVSPNRAGSKSSCSSIDEESPSLHHAQPNNQQLLNTTPAPRRPSLRLETDGRPRFSVSTDKMLADFFIVKKSRRANHMKMDVALFPRHRSFPTIKTAMSEKGEIGHRIGIYGHMVTPLQTKEPHTQDFDSVPAESSAAGYSNASWHSPKESPAPNRLLVALEHSAADSTPVKGPCQDKDHAQYADSLGKQETSVFPGGQDIPVIKITTELSSDRNGASGPGITDNMENSSVVDTTTPTIAFDLPDTSSATAAVESKEKFHANIRDGDSAKISIRISNQTKPKDKFKMSDKISRFLAFQKGKAASRSPCDDVSTEVQSTSASTQKSRQYDSDLKGSKETRTAQLSRHDMPPLKEISVMADSNTSEDPSSPVGPQGVSLPADVVKDVFPYHVILDSDFCIVQVGNNLESLLEQSGLTGRFVNEILTVTNPIPMIQGWDWTVLEKMKDKSMFLESVLASCSGKKRKLKGTMVEVSKSPKRVMLVFFPNVKNLAELEDANLSMADLPLHSCQRETVLFGEHSKSEVNLTHHLDKLHRNLIDSMEQQIKDRTEELAAAFRNLEAANARLALQSARQLEHFACMSHEIRTPLNCIVGMSSLLLDEAEDMEPMHADSIQMINTSGELLKAVVDDVLDYAKLESGSFEVDIKETNLQHTLNSVAHSMSEKMREKNVRLRLDYSPFLPEILETDSRRLQQVLFNLLGNAGKFSKNDSVIDLTVSLVPVVSTGVDPSETSNGQVVRFEIKDYGKGIESKDFQTIFEPFSQASKETQTLYGGTGLGLSITSKLVHRLGGTITLKSEYGKFAEFTVNLPMRGKSVDILRLKKRVQDTTIILVEKPTTYDYNLTDHDIKPEPIPFGAGAAEAYNVDVERYTSLEQALDRIKDPKLVTPRKHYAFLVHEDLYQFGLSEKLESVFGGLNYTLMTFGPEFCVEATKDRHFKSLSGVFASSLLEKIAGHIERRKLKSLSASTTVSIGPASTTIDSCETQKEGADELAGRTGKDLAVGSHTPSPGINASAQRCSDTPNDDRTMSDSSKRSPKTSHEAIPSSDLPISCPKQTTNASTGRHHLKVLYAEDNKVNQKVLSRMLSRAGITNLTIVDNGKKAVDLTENEQFDIIFMDIQMPVMDGMQATKIITERNPLEKVIFCTAHALDEFKEQTEAVGATHFISKPFQLDEINNVFKGLGY